MSSLIGLSNSNMDAAKWFDNQPYPNFDKAATKLAMEVFPQIQEEIDGKAPLNGRFIIDPHERQDRAIKLLSLLAR